MRLLITFTMVVLCVHLRAQETCLSFNLPDSISAECSSCLTLEAPFTQIFETNSYSVTSIDPTLLYPINAGTVVGVGVDDTWSGVIPLGFDFCFFDQTYSSVVLGSNGILTFNLANAGGYNNWNFNQVCPSNQLPVNSIFMPYHDIDPSVCGSVRYQIYGEAPCRKFVVSYDAVCLFSCNNLQSSSQVVLSEGSNAIQVFIVNKAACTGWNQGNGLIGIQNANGTVGFTPPGRNTGPWSASNEAWQFNPNGAPLGSVAWFKDGVQIGSGESIEICPDSSDFYAAELRYEPCSTLLSGGECVGYQVAVNSGSWPSEVSWDLINQEGNLVLSGGAPFNQNVCLPNGCYTLQMFDSFGDGWNGSNFSISYNGALQGFGTIVDGGIGTSSFCLSSYVPNNDDEDDSPPIWASDSIFVSLNLPQYNEGLVLPNVLCNDDQGVLLEANEPGGIWTADCGSCINNATFFPLGLDEGEYEVVYEIESECGPIEQVGVLQIEAYPELQLTVPELMCVDGEAILLQANEAGGIWESPDCDNCINELEESFSSNGLSGIFQINYTFGENCSTMESVLIDVLELNVVEIDLPESWCASAVLDLESFADDGLWESSCETCIDENDQFLGFSSGEGNVDFTFVPNGFCSAPSQDSIFISATVDASITAPAEVCESENSIELFAADSGGAWEASCENCLSEEGVFNPSNLGVNEVDVSYTIEGVCSDSDEVLIVVLEELSASIEPISAICESEQVSLTSSSVQGFWSANCGSCLDEESGLFDATVAGPGTFEVSYLFNEACSLPSTIAIEVLPSVDASIADVAPLCEGSGEVQMIAADSGGEWNASCENCIEADGLFNVTAVEPGIYEVNYAINGVCSDEDMYFLEVLEQANASIFQPSLVCLGSESIELTSINSGGSWSAECGDCINEESGSFYVGDLAVGSYIVEYRIDGFCGDIQSALVEIVPCDLLIPNVFTPNGDGTNEVFEVKNLSFFRGSRLQVFNRWGQEVYGNDDYKNNWDGSGLSEGTYFFLLDVPGLGKYRGELTLLR